MAIETADDIERRIASESQAPKPPYYVIRDGICEGYGRYFVGHHGGDEVWSQRQGRALRWRVTDKEFCELHAAGLDLEARAVRVVAAQAGGDPK